MQKKPRAMSHHKTTHTQLERFKLIDSLLADGNIVPFEKILDALRSELRDFKLSDSSLRRDIRYMRDELGAPLIYDKKNHGWKYTKPFKFPADGFTQDEILYLYLIKKLMNQTSPEDLLAKNMDALLQKISPEIFPKEKKEDEPEQKSISLYDRFFIPARPKLLIDQETAINVFSAIKNNQMLDFTYYSRWEPDKRHRQILPYQLVLDQGSLYLYGADYREKENPRLFKLAKMHDVRIVPGSSFELPQNFRFHEKEEVARFGAFQYDEYYDYKIEFYDEARSGIHEYVWSDNQVIEEDRKHNKTTISFTSSQWESVFNWVLSFGAGARPLEPDWFVEQWKEEINKMKKYL